MQVSLSWPGASGGQVDATCGNSTVWPILDTIVLLGTPVQGNLTLQASQRILNMGLLLVPITTYKMCAC